MDPLLATHDGVGRDESSLPRLGRPNRARALLEPVCLEDRLPPDHPAGMIRQVVERLDLFAFYQPNRFPGQRIGPGGHGFQALSGTVAVCRRGRGGQWPGAGPVVP